MAIRSYDGMIRSLPLLAAASLIASCATTGTGTGTGPVAEQNYDAAGTEPFWGLKISGDRFTFDHLGAEIKTTGTITDASANRWTGRSAEGMALIVTRKRTDKCSDGMSDNTYADEVTVNLGRLVSKGCGGGTIASSAFEGTSWRLSNVDGAPAVGGANEVIAFEGGRMNGSAGCNRIGGDYQQEGPTIVFGPIMATKMACPGPRQVQEDKVLGILQGSVGYAFPDGATLVLTGANDKKIVLKRVN